MAGKVKYWKREMRGKRGQRLSILHQKTYPEISLFLGNSKTSSPRDERIISLQNIYYICGIIFNTHYNYGILVRTLLSSWGHMWHKWVDWIYIYVLYVCMPVCICHLSSIYWFNYQSIHPSFIYRLSTYLLQARKLKTISTFDRVVCRFCDRSFTHIIPNSESRDTVTAQ